MADSLLIDGIIELLGGGKASELPQCPGAVFHLDRASDFGAPQPQTDVIGSLLLDGERPYGRRSSNRTITLPLVIRAPSRAIMVAAREVVLQLVNQDTWQLEWTREGGSRVVFDCFRAKAPNIAYDLLQDKQRICKVTLSFDALPYAHSDDITHLVFDAPLQGSDPAPSPVIMDEFTTVSSGWVKSAQHAMDSYSAQMTMIAHPYTVNNTSTYSYDPAPVYNGVLDPAADLSEQQIISVWIGLGTATASYWNSGSVVFGFTLLDASGRTLTFGTTQSCTASNDPALPAWQQVNVRIPVDASFDFAHVTGYSLRAYTSISQTISSIAKNLWTGKWQSSTQTVTWNNVLPATVYWNHVEADPVTVPVCNVTTRGSVYRISVEGTARAPISMQCQQAALTPFKTLIIHRPGSDAPAGLAPVVNLGNGTAVPNGTAYAVADPAPNVKARFSGTYTILVSGFTFNAPTVPRTLTVAVAQYDYAGGPTKTVTAARTFTPSLEITNGLIVVGEVTLPVIDIAPDNTHAYFTVALTDTNTADRYLDVILLDTMGQTIAVNSAAGYVNYYVDEPDADRDLGRVLGSVNNRAQARSVFDQILAYSGGPLSAEPGDNLLVVYATEGAPALEASYRARWYIDRLD